MIEFLLSDNEHPFLVAFLITITILPFFILGLYNKITYKYKTSILSAFVTSVFVTLFAMLSLFITASTKFEYVSDENWKPIYTNDINAIVKINVDTYTFSFKRKEEIVAGKNINDIQYKSMIYSNNNTITVEKNGASYSKHVLIDKNNIISDNDVNSNSKITKIEYKNIQGHQRTLFGHKGPIEKSDKDKIDGTIRITLEKDSTEKELKQMFENKE